MKIPFNKPYHVVNELIYIQQAYQNSHLSGDGMFTKQCHTVIEELTGTNKALLTHSCTAALEMAAILLDIKPGDEIIMPSYTFVSTANAFVLRGGVPVFVDIRADTLNLDENLIEEAITPRTKAIVPVHYAGVACEMDKIMAIAKQYNLYVVEDAAQGVMAKYKNRALGSIGDLGTYSFHETKNIISGEGGALLVNRNDFVARAEIIREKGTDRSQFFRGAVDKYTWQDVGSSFLPSEIIAAFLFAQLEVAEQLTQQRLALWQHYHNLLETLESRQVLRRPIIPDYCQHNAHMYYILLAPEIDRQMILDCFKEVEIGAVFHYVPLHLSPAGQRFSRAHGSLSITNQQSEVLVRLPLWIGMTASQQEKIVDLLNVKLT